MDTAAVHKGFGFFFLSAVLIGLALFGRRSFVDMRLAPHLLSFYNSLDTVS
jgi:hypothetical protein